MTGVRASFTRRMTRNSTIVLFAILAAAMLLAAGCSEEDTKPTYPPQPENPVGTWFLGIWGSSADDIYVVGQPGLIFHWDGTAWTQQESGTTQSLTDVWGDDAGNVYITGHEGTILQKSGSGWSKMSSGTSMDLYSIGTYQGTVMATGFKGALRQLVGSAWQEGPEMVYLRDQNDAVTDSFSRIEDDRIESLAAVTEYGIAGADGVVLMEDEEYDWLQRRVTGGENWVTCSSSDERVSGNFIATDGGRLFQLSLQDGDRYAWDERYSPALDSVIYGIYSDTADSVWAVTNDGKINRVDPDNSFHALYEDGLTLFDIWGTSGTNLYAVGIDARVLHFHEISPGEFGWEIMVLLPLDEITKSMGKLEHATNVTDKFGRLVP